MAFETPHNILNRFCANPMCVCVDGERGAESYRLYHRRTKDPVRFSDISALFLEIERLYDNLICPQSSTEPRSFIKAKKQTADYNRKETTMLMSAQEVKDRQGERATFVIHVQYRQNATWQGSVVWAEKNITKNFRSALELLKLMDGALDETGIPQD